MHRQIGAAQTLAGQVLAVQPVDAPRFVSVAKPLGFRYRGIRAVHDRGRQFRSDSLPEPAACEADMLGRLFAERQSRE